MPKLGFGGYNHQTPRKPSPASYNLDNLYNLKTDCRSTDILEMPNLSSSSTKAVNESGSP